MATPTLTRLLDDNLRRPPEYGAGLSNHLPMALHALHVLGAGDADLDRFATDYVRRKQLATTPADDGARSRSPRLGDFASFPAWQANFSERIAADGPRRTLVEALPELWPGVAAAAFHGPIRLAHAWEMGHPGELAAALAYWAARWQRVDVAPEVGPTMDIAEWLAAAEAAARSFRGDGRLISQRMDEAARMPAFRAFAGRLRPSPDVLATVARQAAGLYAD
ncbi:MAG TPA: questin oxidase family protein, partial [Ramlibacter sp.]